MENGGEFLVNKVNSLIFSSHCVCYSGRPLMQEPLVLNKTVCSWEVLLGGAAGRCRGRFQGDKSLYLIYLGSSSSKVDCSSEGLLMRRTTAYIL